MNRTRSSFAALGFLLLGAGLISTLCASQKMSNSATPPRSGGLAAVANLDRSGSPLSSGTCSNCHSGGAFSPILQIEVKDAGNNTVTSYTPGAQYTIEYTVSATSGSPSGYGMQASILTTSNTNAGNHGAVITSNTQVSTIGGIQLLEQQGVSSTGFFAVNWTAPTNGTGNVSIYGNGIAVNGTGGTSGDAGSSVASITLTEDVQTSIDFPYNPYCANAPDPTAVVTGQQGGVFVSSPSGLDIGTVSGQINMSASTPGTYTVTYTAGGQSTTFDVTINDTYTVSDAATICANETLQFGTQTLTSADAGLNTEVFQSINGCDSTVNLTLTVLSAPVTQLSQTICSNETIQFNGQTLDASNVGLNTFTTSGSNGCDSTVEMTLTVLPLDTVQISETICDGETFDFNGQILDASNAGLNTATLSNVNGCDSVVELTLNVTTIDLTIIPTLFQLSVSQQTNATYQWLDCENNYAIVPNETSDELIVGDVGTWAAEITIAGCVDTTDCEVPLYMGIDENSSSLLRVYPSPARSELQVQNLSELTDVDLMQIVNLSGRLVWSSEEMIEKVNVRDLPAGTYFLKVRHAKGEEVVKFMKR